MRRRHRHRSRGCGTFRAHTRRQAIDPAVTVGRRRRAAPRGSTTSTSSPSTSMALEALAGHDDVEFRRRRGAQLFTTTSSALLPIRGTPLSLEPPTRRKSLADSLKALELGRGPQRAAPPAVLSNLRPALRKRRGSVAMTFDVMNAAAAAVEARRLRAAARGGRGEKALTTLKLPVDLPRVARRPPAAARLRRQRGGAARCGGRRSAMHLRRRRAVAAADDAALRHRLELATAPRADAADAAGPAVGDARWRRRAARRRRGRQVAAAEQPRLRRRAAQWRRRRRRRRRARRGARACQGGARGGGGGGGGVETPSPPPTRRRSGARRRAARCTRSASTRRSGRRGATCPTTAAALARRSQASLAQLGARALASEGGAHLRRSRRASK